MKNKFLTFLLVLGVIGATGFISSTTYAETLEVGESRSLGTTVEVPITVRDAMYLSSGNFVIDAPSATKGIKLKSFSPTPAFKSGVFRTKWKITNNSLDINFLTPTGKEERLVNKKIVVGHLVYELSKDFKTGDSLNLDITTVNMKGRANVDLSVDSMNGKVVRKMPVGDVVGNNKPTAAAAIRILQHLNKPITDREAFLSADVDGDGALTQVDAQIILDYVAGKRNTFLAVQAKELGNAVVKNEYKEQVNAVNGRAPYQYKKTGSMPTGLSINSDTGEITGTPSREGTYNFTIQVTDALGDIEKRAFTIEVIDSNIISVEKILPINVKIGETPQLPAKVLVTYKDKKTGYETVKWQTVNTSKIGTVSVAGQVGDSGFTIGTEVNIVSANYLESVIITYEQFLNIHTIEIDVSSDVYRVSINDTPMHYEGDQKYSLVTPSLKASSTIIIRMYDKYGNLVETKQQPLIPN